MTTTGTRVREDSDLGRIPGLVIFYIGCAVHLLFLVSLLTHWLDPLFFEATTDYGQASDYFGIYQAGDNLTQGRSIYLEGGRPEDSDRHVPYYYFYRYLPPTATFMALTALLLKPWPSYWVWVVINEALLGLTLFSLRRLRSPPSALRRALAGLTLGFSPLYLELWMGQFSLLMAVLLWVTFWPELRAGAEGGGRIPAAGEGEGPPESWPQAGPKERFRALLRQPSLWCWSASVALKNYPAFFAFPWLRLGRWRRVFLGAGLVALSCLPYFLLRPHDVGLYRTA
ncbi:MAG TPA: glycosyltransferase 87 family protein, partial [Spirochaetia bacterium]|nr:glycosyltransferase 87 family protein [Spirochaetia bacterium]